MKTNICRSSGFGDSKRCSTCGRDLPLSEFNKNKNKSDGLQDACRSCFSEYNKARYAANREKYKSDVYRYRAEHPERVLSTRLRTCEKNPTQRNAYRALSQAIESGLVDRQNYCSGCGVSGDDHRIEAHHHDYSKPLDVIWLCKKCHYQVDDARRSRERELGLPKPIQDQPTKKNQTDSKEC